MASGYSPRLSLPQMGDGEQSGYVTFNELGRVLDAILNTDVEDVTLTAPPGGEQEGQVWLVAPGATGAWAGKDFNLAQWYNGAWYFYVPPQNITLYDKATDQRIWVDYANSVIQPLSTALAILSGSPTNGTLSTGGLDLVGWDSVAELGRLVGSMNASTGVFTAPTTYTGKALYSITIHVHGDQGNSTKEESIYLETTRAGGENDGTIEIAHESVDTDKTDGRTLQAGFSTSMVDGETLIFRLRATANLGTFNFQACTFQVRKSVEVPL